MNDKMSKEIKLNWGKGAKVNFYLKILTFIKPERFFHAYLLCRKFESIINVTTKELDFDKIITIVKDDPILLVTNKINTNLINSQEILVNNLIKKIEGFISCTFDITGSNINTQQQFTQLIENVFVNLNSQVQENVYFYKENEKQTSYRYNVLFVFEKESFVTILPMEFDVIVNASKESVLKLTSKDIVTYAQVAVKALNIIHLITEDNFNFLTMLKSY